MSSLFGYQKERVVRVRKVHFIEIMFRFKIVLAYSLGCSYSKTLMDLRRKFQIN